MVGRLAIVTWVVGLFAWATLAFAGSSPEHVKALAFAAAHTGNSSPEIRSLDLIDLNRDGTPEALLVLGGSFCGARYCDGFVLDLSGAEARVIGSWPVASLEPGMTRLNGWLDLRVNGASRRFLEGRYEAH